MPDDKINIRLSEEDSNRHRGVRRKGRKQKAGKPHWPLIVGVNAALAVLAAAVYFTLFRTGGEPAKPVDASGNAAQKTAVKPAETTPEPPEPQPRETLVEDDGRTLWASPTEGLPISLAYVPEGSQILLYLRPAALVAHPEGGKVLAALGSWGQHAADQLRQQTGAELEEIESALVTPVVLDNGELGSSLRVTLSKPWTAEELARRIPGGNEQTSGSESYRLAGERAYWLPADADGSTLVVCPQEIVAGLIGAGSQPASVVRDLQRLLAQSDAQRTATLLVSPRFLDAGGSGLLVDSARRLRDAIDWLFGREGTSFSLSVDWGDDFFAELRSTPQLQMPPQRYAQQLRERIDESPDVVESQILEANWHPFGRRVLARFPSMLRKLAGYTRSQVDERHALLRCYLPVVAGHNLLMAGELLLTQPRGEGALVAVAETAAPKSVEERLAQITTLSFPKDTLEQALKLLSEDIGVSIEILGRDLQLEGITKNQSFEIDLQDQPAEAILLEIMRRSNPDRTAENAADVKQKLVYVVRPAEGDAPGRIEVTTRTAAEKRGDKLPAAFTNNSE